MIARIARIGMMALTIGSVLVNAACSIEEDDDSSDPLIGTWTSSCGRLFTDTQTVAACGAPTDSTCEAKYQRYYQVITATFTSAGDVSDTQTHNQLSYAIATYYNSDADTAATCAADDKVATFTTVQDYQINESPLESTFEVTTDNGFPENAKPINLQSISYSRTYHLSSLLSHLNADEVCEDTSWVADTAVSLTNKENCSTSMFANTEMYAEENAFKSSMIDEDYEDDANFTSGFIAGTQEFSIFIADGSTDPKTLQLGRAHVDSDGTWTQTEYETASAHDGTSEKQRYNLLNGAMTFSE